MNPSIFYTESSFKRSTDEANKFFDIGITKTGGPFEAAMYPLFYVCLHDDVAKSPLDLVTLNDIDYVVVMDVAIPPDNVKEYSGGYCGFNHQKILEIEDAFNQEIESIKEKNPLLVVIGKQHSHPFSSEPSPSARDWIKVRKSYSWFQKKGFLTMFTLIMVPSFNLYGWRIGCFGVGNRGERVNLGDVIVIPDGHIISEKGQQKPYWQTDEGKSWEQNTTNILKASGFRPSVSHSNRGWMRYDITKMKESISILIPPEFPKKKALVYELRKGIIFEINAAAKLDDISLFDIINNMK